MPAPDDTAAPGWTGPVEDWRIDWGTYGGPYIRYPMWPHPENGHTIAKLHFADPTPFEEKKKRACLVAAAPSLAEALSRLVDRYHPYRDNHDDRDWASAVAALALARGET